MTVLRQHCATASNLCLVIQQYAIILLVSQGALKVNLFEKHRSAVFVLLVSVASGKLKFCTTSDVVMRTDTSAEVPLQQHFHAYSCKKPA